MSGRELREARHASGLTLAELAARCDPPMDPANIARIESGRVTPTKTTVARLRRALAAAEAAAK
jgi:predicted transcriptional regulator